MENIKKTKKDNFNKHYRPIKVVEIIFKYFFVVFMIVYAISLLIPVFWMLMSSLKAYDDYTLHTFQLPQKWVFYNYVEMIQKFKLERMTVRGPVVYGPGAMILYSVIWSFLGTLIPTFTMVVTSYIISRFKFVGKEFLYGLGIFLMITPIVGTFPVAMRLAKALHYYDTMLPRLFIRISGNFYGFYFLLLYGMWKGIPYEYSEAASLDGASQVQIFMRIMVPMIVPTYVVIFVLSFMAEWNNYMEFLIWMPSYPNLALGIYLFQYKANTYGVGMPVILAGFVMVSIPTALMYLLSRKTIMSNMMVGGLKG